MDNIQTPWCDNVFRKAKTAQAVLDLARRLEALCRQQQEALIADNYDAVAKKTKFQKEQAALAAFAAIAKEMNA